METLIGSKRVLVAGASGQLGKALIRELHSRGFTTRALVRRPDKLREVRRDVDEIYTGEATRPETLTGVCGGIEVVISALGAPLNLNFSRERVSYRDVDYAANRNLLLAAKRAGVKKFIYVSIFGAHLLGNLEYVRAHEEFVRDLKASGMDYTIVRPTGFFYSLGEIVRLARKGIVATIGDGSCRTNPIHEADLAAVCVDAITDQEREITVGGRETYTRNEITELAFRALGKRTRTISVPAGLIKAVLLPLRLFDRRLHALMTFLIAVSQVDVIAPSTGTYSLANYFCEVAQEKQNVRTQISIKQVSS